LQPEFGKRGGGEECLFENGTSLGIFKKQTIWNFLSMTSKIKIPDKFVTELVKLPENGMGYQLVKVFLNNGKVLRKHKVLNSSLLVLEHGEIISSIQIEKMELE
jgi:hypothetical protein